MKNVLMIAACLALLLTDLRAAEQTHTWKAGVARQVITPPQPMWMSGYASRDRPADGTLHDLYVKALAIRSPSGKQAVLITADLIGVPRSLTESVRQQIHTRLGLPPQAIMICTSHTHTGPFIYDNLMPMVELSRVEADKVRQYSERLPDQIVATATQALQAQKPVTIAYGNGQASFAVNRRNNPEADVRRLRAEGRLVGPVDHDVPVLRVLTQDDELLAVVFGYACHCTVLSSFKWSGDYAGFAQIELEKSHPGTTAMFFAGCGGDQNPLPRRKVELAERYGGQLASAVEDVLASDMTPVRQGLAMKLATVDLQFDQIPTTAELLATRDSQNPYERRRAELLLKQFEDEGAIRRSYPYPIQIWQLDGLTWFALGGEVVVEYSLRLKKQHGPETTWVAGYANDVMAYIPSERVWREGGYEGVGAMVYYGLPSRWKSNVEDVIIGKAAELMQQTIADSK